MARQLYSDRNNGPQPRDQDVLGDGTVRALLGVVRNRINGNWLANEYPETCPDGNGIWSTNTGALYTSIEGLIPDFEWRRGRDDLPSQDDLFDLIEFVGSKIAKPSDGPYHSFYKHSELNFDVGVGRLAYAEEINQFLQRGRATFELDRHTMHISRIGTPEVQAVVADLKSNSGDAKLDALLTDARLEYLSRVSKVRQGALQKLWDAFERLKTLEPGADKKAQIAALLANFTPQEWRDTLNDEMNALTKIGNTFHIRHFETDKIPVPAEAEDYLFTRMGALIILLLRHTGRLL